MGGKPGGVDKRAALRRLADERQRLEDLLDAADSPAKHDQRESLHELSFSDQHPADLATDTFERTRDLSILATIEAQLNDVEHALRRLEEGHYELCEACGRPIGAERLEAVPAARFCLEDQARKEREVQE